MDMYRVTKTLVLTYDILATDEDDAITGATDADDMKFEVESIDYSAELLADVTQRREGWRLSERSDGFYAIEKDDETDIFDNDLIAYAYVKQRAALGSVLHAEAIAKHGDPFEKACAA